MNAELRIKLKKVDNTLRKFGYALEPYPKTLFLNKLNEFDDEGISSYIHLYMHKIPMDNGLYRLIFTAEPCRISGGYDYMELDLAESICIYWKKMINSARELTNLNIVATEAELVECARDIVKKRRRN